MFLAMTQLPFKFRRASRAYVNALTSDERARYARHIMLKEIGGPGQLKLRGACIALVGAGGLGAPAALYLAAAGVGRLRIIDDDTVALSNLQRQVLFRTEDIGLPKTERAAATLASLNPHIVLEAQRTRLTADNAPALLDSADIVLDGTDDFTTRYIVNAACHTLGITLISGAVGRWEGQLATFKSGQTKAMAPTERLPCYRCLVPEAPPDAETCERVGIVGALPGVIGAMMALEAVKELTGSGKSLAGRLLIYNSLSAEARTIVLRRDPACVECGDV